LANELGTVVTGSTYGGSGLLDGTLSSATFIIGTLSSSSITTSALTALTSFGTSAFGTVSAFTSASVSSATAAQAAMSSLSNAILDVTQYRADVGAYESQFNFISESINTTSTNTTAAKSAILDADEAQQKSNLSSQDVLSQAAIAALTQAAKMPQELLQLLQS
jgi:flagellin